MLYPYYALLTFTFSGRAQLAARRDVAIILMVLAGSMYMMVRLVFVCDCLEKLLVTAC